MPRHARWLGIFGCRVGQQRGVSQLAALPRSWAGTAFAIPGVRAGTRRIERCGASFFFHHRAQKFARILKARDAERIAFIRHLGTGGKNQAMTNAGSAPAATRTSAFAQLWLMLRQIFAMMLKPGFTGEAEAKMAELEIQTARSILARVLANDPAAAGLTVDDFEITRLWNAAGVFDPDFALKPHVLAARLQSRRAFYLQLRHVRLVRQMLAWIATLRGLRGKLRRKAGVSRIHRLRAALCACARIADRAAPRQPIPP